jgi:hypothetical protein
VVSRALGEEPFVIEAECAAGHNRNVEAELHVCRVAVDRDAERIETLAGIFENQELLGAQSLERMLPGEQARGVIFNSSGSAS